MQADEILEYINKYSASTLKQVKKIPAAHLERIVAGQLRSTITAHGPITKENIGSATKRIVTQILAKL